MLSVTPTKLNDYLTCPHKYKLKHLDKIGNRDYSAALSFGQSIHGALQELYRSKKPLSEFGAAAEIKAMLKRHWDANAYSEAEESEACFLKGCRALKNYCEAFEGSKETTIGTEVYLSYILKFGGLQARLGCKADRISVHDDIHGDRMLEIIDYKTNGSGKVPTVEFLQNDLPTFLYYALARIAYPEYKNIRISFLNVLTLAKASVEYDPVQVARNKQKLFECLKCLAGNSFDPVPSEACSWCSFQDICAAVSKIVDFASIT